MKVKLNPMFEEARGQLGELIFREIRGKTVASRKPSGSNEPTVEQIAQRELFKQAALYGKAALADPTARALYEEAAKEKDIPIFALTIADFFNAPVIQAVDLLAYQGQPGEEITIRAHDDFGLVQVTVAITDAATNFALDGGEATEVAPGAGVWVFTASAAVPAGTTAKITVVATDRPGGTAVETVTKAL